jgi:large subunit ribosomal protein L30
MEATTTTKKAAPKKTTAPKAAVAPKAAPAKQQSNGKLALILLRGMINTKKDIIATMDKFRLRQRLVCVVVEDNETNRFAAMKCKDYITFGTITEETYKALVDKRGEKDMDGNLKKYFRMHPPRGGFEKKGIKIPYSMGGALGNRKEKMNELIMKML